MHPLAIVALVVLGLAVLGFVIWLVVALISVRIFKSSTKQMGKMFKDFDDEFFK